MSLRKWQFSRPLTPCWLVVEPDNVSNVLLHISYICIELTNSNDKLVVGQVEVLLVTVRSNGRDLDQLGRKVDILGLALQEVTIDSGDNSSDRLDKGSDLESADRGRGQHGSKQKVVGRGDNSDMVVIWVQLLQQGHAAPTSAQNDKLRLVFLSLLLWRVIVIDQMVNNGQVLGPSPARIQSILGHIQVDEFGILLVCRCIIGKEGEH